MMTGTVKTSLTAFLAVPITMICAELHAQKPDVPGSAEMTRHSYELVVLIHGFGRTSRDMRFLKRYFEKRGYSVYAPTLPTFFRSVDDCAGILAEKLAEQDRIGSVDRVHFVGHSMGGLILRRFLAQNTVPNLGRCILIGSPSGGTPLGAMVKKYLPPLTWISPVYRSFQPGGIPIPLPRNDPPPDFGAIAGCGSGLFLGRLIEGPNDGRVPVGSVTFEGMTAFIVLPYHHEEIHYQHKTAEVIEWFLTTGRFTP
ncbi:esterase/lipase family protein [Candidatus Latescibacterota bacterium]